MSIKEVNDSNFETTLQEKPVCVVKVFATWCGTCRLFSPHFEDVANAYKDFNFVELNGEENPKARDMIPDINNLPFVAVFHQGEYVGGKLVTKKEDLEAMLQVVKEKTQ